MDRKLQRHRADSLRQHGFLVHNSSQERLASGATELDLSEMLVFWITNYSILKS